MTFLCIISDCKTCSVECRWTTEKVSNKIRKGQVGHFQNLLRCYEVRTPSRTRKTLFLMTSFMSEAKYYAEIRFLIRFDTFWLGLFLNLAIERDVRSWPPLDSNSPVTVSAFLLYCCHIVETCRYADTTEPEHVNFEMIRDAVVQYIELILILVFNSGVNHQNM